MSQSISATFLVKTMMPWSHAATRKVTAAIVLPSTGASSALTGVSTKASSSRLVGLFWYRTGDGG